MSSRGVTVVTIARDGARLAREGGRRALGYYLMPDGSLGMTHLQARLGHLRGRTLERVILLDVPLHDELTIELWPALLPAARILGVDWRELVEQ